MPGSTRRDFLRAGSTAVSGICLAPFARLSPSRKLQIGVIGCGGRGQINMNGVAREEIAALCDVDADKLAPAAQRFPSAKTFVDFRDLLRLDTLDAVVISTPDHSHAPAAAMALRSGLDVYCEKPLAHDIAEVRSLMELAAEHKAVTQMGTQIHALPNYRRAVEHVQSGVIGSVERVHVFCRTAAWGGVARPAGEKPVPDNLDWDLWLGAAPTRSYQDGYHPVKWRRYWDFGGGNLADMGCHYMDLAFWALDLRHPETIRARGPQPDPGSTPRGLVVDYRFPARGDAPAVELSWYDAGRRPPILADLGLQDWHNGVLFLGTEGRFLIADYSNMEVGPAAAFRGFTPPAPFIKKSIGHRAEWIEACKTRAPTSCSFDYSGPLTEAVLLGNISFRCGGARLEWHPQDMKLSGADGADALIAPEYHNGWRR